MSFLFFFLDQQCYTGIKPNIQNRLKHQTTQSINNGLVQNMQLCAVIFLDLLLKVCLLIVLFFPSLDFRQVLPE